MHKKCEKEKATAKFFIHDQRKRGSYYDLASGCGLKYS